MPIFASNIVTPDSALGGKIIEKSLRFNGDDTYLTKASTSTTGNRSKWTWSAWVKRTLLGSVQDLYSAYDPRGFYNIIRFGTDDQLNFQSNSAAIKKTNRKFRDTTGWYHIVVVIDTPNTTAADRVIIYVNGSRETFETDNQVLPSEIFAFNQAHVHTLGVYADGSNYNFDGYMADIHFRDGEALDPTYFGFTESQTGMWLPKPYTGTFTNVNSNSLNDGTTWNSTYANAFNGTATDSGAGDGAYTGLNSTFTINFPGDGVVVNSSLQFQGYAPASAQSTFDQYVDIYVNGTERTCTIVSGSENGTHSAVHNIDFTGTMTSLRMQSKPTSNNGISQVIVDGEILVNGLNARGNNSYHIDFMDDSGTTATTLGKDTSGNANNYTPNNFSVTAGEDDDSFTFTPTNQFPTFHTLYSSLQCGGSVAYSEGGFKIVTTASGSNYNRYPFAMSSPEFAVNSGKWYVEFKCGSTKCAFGICNTAQFDSDMTNNPYGAAARTSLIYTSEGQLRGNNSDIRNGNGSFTTNDIIGIALDLDNMKIYFHKNGTYINSGNPNTGANPDTVQDLQYNNSGGYVFQAGSDGQNNITAHANFGQRAFSYSIPTGYKTLTRDRLPDNIPSIVRPQRHFDTLTWTGNDSSDRNIEGLEFKPDMVWIKNRSQTDFHVLQDSVRGANKLFFPNDTDVEQTDSANGHVNYFTSGGFNVDAGGSGFVNENGENYVAWCWKAGGAAVSNSDGTITSSISVNQEAGFSIVSYTGNGTAGATVGHGLGKKPAWILLIRRDSNDNRYIYHQFMNQGSNPEQHYSELNFHAGATDSNKIHNDTAPTTSVFSLSNDNASNGNTYPYIAYCWAEIPGYSKFGEYRANGVDDDGPYTHLGFRPAWVMIKSMSLSNSDWTIFDNKRNTVHPANIHLAANQSHADGSDTYEVVDFLANGFRVTGLSGSAINYNTSYPHLLYMAFAEQPSVTPFDTISNAR